MGVRSTQHRLARFLGRSFPCWFLGHFGRFFGSFLVFSDSRIVRESPQVPRLWKPCHLGCPRVPAGRQDGTPWLETLPPRSGFHHYESGSSGTAWFRRPARAALLAGLRGLRFELLYFCGALGRMPWGTQGLVWDALNNGFSFRKEVRPGELLKACPFFQGAANSTQPASREEPSFEGQKEGVKLKSTQHTTTMALHFHLRVSVTS